MTSGKTTLGRFILEEQRGAPGATGELSGLLQDLGTALKTIAVEVGRGAAAGWHDEAARVAGTPERPRRLDQLADEIVLHACEWGGQLAGFSSEEREEIIPTPPERPCGKYLLLLDPLDGSTNIDVNLTVGSIFSILRRPDGAGCAAPADFLQAGSRQVCAGYAIYGPATLLVLTFGRGVHGFTLDRELGEFVLTHRDLRIPEDARELAIEASNERFWEPPVKRYVEECVAGLSGPRAAEFRTRWIASTVAEVHRILMRGGVFIAPGESADPHRKGRLRLLHEANPMAMIVESAGGAASTGRERLLDLVPSELHQRAPVVLGSRAEVERVVRYHDEHARGVDRPYSSPLFRTRSLFTEH